ncbi:copper homeostasis periplasmic binding protein CopC [Caulobacter sp. 1776]|uniref:copper homeostasis periplasmic binding protein CopC n=1 Tax=Caulobacter sp. 1776 TaxID=3156420 RepID=UPI003396C0A8
MSLRSDILIAATMAALALSAGQASAHAKLVSSDPAANATVAPPKAIHLTFNEKLAPTFSSFELAMADGLKSPVKTSLSADRKTINGRPKAPLGAGVYKLTWHAAAADDGHRMDGAITFTVK